MIAFDFCSAIVFAKPMQGFDIIIIIIIIIECPGSLVSSVLDY